MVKDEVFNTYPEVQVYLKKIIETFSPQKVILFGSKTNKNATERSDADFAIVTSKPFDENQIIGALDIINYERADKELQRKIDDEGIVLYEKKNEKIF